MHRDRTDQKQEAYVSEDSGPFAVLDGIHREFRHAVEDRNYLRLQELVAQQRAVFDRAGHQHPEAHNYAVAGRDMVAWALTMVRLQRSHDQHAWTNLVAFKKASDSYASELVSTIDCVAEG